MTDFLRVAAELSHDFHFRYTQRNLFYALARADLVDAKGGVASYEAFVQELSDYERDNGPLRQRIGPGDVAKIDQKVELDGGVLDYSVRRMLIFDRVDLFLLFVLNGFHRKIEVGLVLESHSPPHAWARLETQLRDGLYTGVFLLHDCDANGLGMGHRLGKALSPESSFGVSDVGLGFEQAYQLGIPVLQLDRPAESLLSEIKNPETRLLLQNGRCAFLEAMAPFDLLQWTYGEMVSRGAEEVGFG